MVEIPSFDAASEAYLAGLLDALPAYVARLENELAREGVGDLAGMDALEDQLRQGLVELFALAPARQAETPMGLVRRLVLLALSEHAHRVNVAALDRRGLLPRSAVDIAPELAPLQVQWGLAKARALGAEPRASQALSSNHP